MTASRGTLAAAAFTSAMTAVPQTRVRSVFAKLLAAQVGPVQADRDAFVAGQRAAATAAFGDVGSRLVDSLEAAWEQDPPTEGALAVWDQLLTGLPVTDRHPLKDPTDPPRDLFQSLAARAGRISKETGLPLDHVRRSIVIDRLLQRLMADTSRDWILKGGTALASRRAVLGFTARKTLDLDAAVHAGQPEAVLADLDRAAALELNDGVTFRRSSVEEVKAQGKIALRVKYDMIVNNRTWEPVKVEVVEDTELTCRPVLAPASPSAGDAHGWHTLPYRTVHPADHVADKWAGITERQPNGHTSTRYRDLLDLVTIASSETLEAVEAIRACNRRRQRPGMTEDVTRFTLPGPDWAPGYRKVAAAAARLGIPEAVEFPEADQATVLAGVFLDPVLDGTWSPAHRAWQTPQTPPPRNFT